MSNLFNTARDTIRGNCQHSEVEENVFHVVGDLWPVKKRSFSEVRLIGINLQKCKKCGIVLWRENEKELFDSLNKACLSIESFCKENSSINIQDITINFDNKKAFTTLGIIDSDKKLSGANSFKIENPKFDLQDVVLPTKTLKEIQEAIVKVKYHSKIYKDWKFGEIDHLGECLILNFYGPSGTGKTRCAEALAGELNREWIPVNVSDMESHYMGQTANNIKKLFEEAHDSSAVVFFDEADSILSSRFSSVKQGIEAELNSIKTTLLKEIEKFQGVCIFATNFPEAYDSAFSRRIAYHIKFHMPNEIIRKKIWKMHLIETIPLREDRDALIESLAKETEGFSGGDVLTAMRLALPMALSEVSENACVSIEHFREAIDRIHQAKSNIGKKSMYWK